MTLAILSDIHLHNWSQFSVIREDGVNNRLRILLDHIESAAEHLIAEGGTNLYIAGDLFHVRGNIPPSVLNPTLSAFQRILAHGVQVRIIPGNHDLEGKHSTELSSAVTSLRHLGCFVCNESMYFADDDMVMIPWYDKLEDLTKEMQRWAKLYPMADCIIHAPLNGVISGIPDHGLDARALKTIGFRRIFCGHYHNHVDFENGVYSIGALTHQTWGDVGTKAGYILLNDEGVTHVLSRAPSFVDFPIAETDKDKIKQICSGQYVRVRSEIMLSETEIADLRREIVEVYGALSVIIQAQIKPKNALRVSTVKTGVTLEDSVHDFIGKQDRLTEEERSKLSALCVDILASIKEVEL